MTRQSLWLIILLLIFTGLFGYNYFEQPFANKENIAASQLSVVDQQQVEPTPLPAEAIVKQLTPRQKIAQLLAVSVTIDQSFATLQSTTQSAQLQWVAQENPGSVVFFGTKVSTVAAKNTISLITSAQQENAIASISSFFAVDHEGGVVQRFNGAGFTALKSWQELCGLDSVAAQIALEQSAEELSAVGISVLLGPVLDSKTTQSPLLSRTCSADVAKITERARLATSIYQDNGIVPVYKHFPGIGNADKDLHKVFDSVLVGEAEAKLYRDLLTAYSEQPLGVMVSHVGVENQDASVPCSMNASCVGQLKENFPSVLLYSDDVLMVSAYQGLKDDDKTLYNVVLQALLAGNQQVIIGPGVDARALNELLILLEDTYKKNSFVAQVIDASVTRVIDFKLTRNQLQ